MGKVLLIGNGINRCVNEEISSDNIIKVIFNLYTNIDKDKVRFPTSFPLQFEMLSLLNKKDDDKLYSFIKDKLDKFLKTKKTTNNHPVYSELKKLIKGKIKIITTNYDFSIEQHLFDAKISDLKQKNKQKRNKGFLYEGEDWEVFHIHGDLKHYNNICLGEINYNKYLRSYMSNVSSNALSNPYNNASKITNKIYPQLKSFFEDDICIIGFALNENEKIIWTLLLLRAQLIKSGVCKNKIYFLRLVMKRLKI